jgi:hypothetical protein
MKVPSLSGATLRNFVRYMDAIYILLFHMLHWTKGPYVDGYPDATHSRVKTAGRQVTWHDAGLSRVNGFLRPAL